MFGRRAALAAAAVMIAGAAEAAEIRIVDFKAYAFLERSGKLSANLIGGPPIVDAPRGGAFGGDTASSLLVDFTFAGPKNAAPKYAAATVDFTQTGLAGREIVTRQAFAGFRFGPDGLEHKALFLENAMCAPLVIAVHAGRTQKTARLALSCRQRVVETK